MNDCIYSRGIPFVSVTGDRLIFIIFTKPYLICIFLHRIYCQVDVFLPLINIAQEKPMSHDDI